MKRLLASIIPALLLAGCASVTPGGGFGDVASTVTDRTGMRVHWDVGSDADEEVAAAVRDLLSRELTAPDAVQVALLNNRDLQATYEDLSVAQADLVEAGLLRNPIFDAQVRFSTAGGGTGVELGLVQDFIDLFAIPLRKARGEAAYEGAKLRVAGAVIELAGEVQRGFYDYQAAEQTVELRRTTVEAAAAAADLARRLREAGNITELDHARERAFHEQARLDLAAAEGDAAQSRERLNALMGLWGGATAWRAAPRLPEPAADEFAASEVERRAVEASLDLGASQRDIEVAARELGIARPFAALGEWEAGVSAEREVEGDWSVGPAVALPIPLFNQGQGTVARAQAELRRAGERHRAMATRIRSRARAAHAAVVVARDRAEHYRTTILPLRQTILEQSQLQYNAMQIGPFQLLQARRDLTDAAAGYIDALRDYWSARSALEQLLSGRMPDETTRVGGEGRTAAGMGSGRPGSREAH